MGHIAVKLAVAMGAQVTVISTSETKQADALRLGATTFLLSTDTKRMQAARETIDFILDVRSITFVLFSVLSLSFRL